MRHRDVYRNALTSQIARLGEFPFLGPARDDVFDGCRCLPVGHHIAYYHVTDDTVVVLRLLHERQDPRGAVTKEDAL